MPKKKMPRPTFEDGAAVRAYRKKKRMNQTDFCARVQATQSRGSRFESGRSIPNSVKVLLTLAYGTDATAQRVLEALRSSEQ